MLAHPLFKTLVNLKGNPRVTVYTEPMFGIPYNLFIPYASVYMLAMGVTDQQIGLIASLGLGLQIFSSLISGAITDKFGRRLTLLVADILSWGVPCLIWAIAQDFRYFLAAAMFNGLWRISHTSWSCLLVEDAKPEEMVHIWTWIYIFAVGAAFFTPLAGFLVERFRLVPTVRMLYLFAFLVLMIKFIILYRYSTETKRGRERREETRGQSLFTLMGEYRGVFGQLRHAHTTLAAMAILVVMSIYMTVNGTFWAVLVTEKLQIPSEHISWFPFVRSLVMMAGFFLITPRLNALHFKRPLWVGFLGFLASQFLLVVMPAKNYPLLFLMTAMDAFSYALVSPVLDSLLVLTIDAQERARITGIVYVGILVFASPFGWIAGQLSAINRTWPFMLNMGVFLLGLGLVWIADRFMRQAEAAQEAVQAA